MNVVDCDAVLEWKKIVELAKKSTVCVFFSSTSYYCWGESGSRGVANSQNLLSIIIICIHKCSVVPTSTVLLILKTWEGELCSLGEKKHGCTILYSGKFSRDLIFVDFADDRLTAKIKPTK